MAGTHRRISWRLYVAVAAVLCAVGITLIAVSWAGSRTGPPMPPASAAGSIDGPGVSSASATRTDRAGEPERGRTPGDAASTDPITRSTAALATTAPSDTRSSPEPSNPRVTTVPSPTTGTAHTAVGTPTPDPTRPDLTGPVLPASAPVSLSIPTIGVDAPLIDLGLNADGSVQVPDLNDPDSKPGWYKNSPTPGSAGPSIILGHIDSAKYGPGVFYRLGTLKPGDTVDIGRADGTVAVFRIDGVRSYGKDDFPTLEVYGNIDHAGLRLITCGGTFDPGSGHYESNIVAYATLVSSHRA
ncbi:class F sortase [Nakamurella lactea]|uniref:class F sortase n=1 Tax=Nakamurella lactea TaxID=459515 RepID=UPI0003FAB723|nr:class F sortase [Nakamurella lactea]